MSAAHRVGQTIKSIRNEQGLSGADLGAACGLGKDQISKIENGHRKVSAMELADIATRLGVVTRRLLGVETSASGVMQLAARVTDEGVKAGTDAQAEGSAYKRVADVLNAESVMLSSGMSIPSHNLSAGGQRVRLAIENSLDMTGSDRKVGERLAALARAELDLGSAPINSVHAVIEKDFGLDVVTAPTNDKVAGLCARSDDGFLIFVNTKAPRVRQRFTAAHELAHWLLGDTRDVVVDTFEHETTSGIESRADEFAASFLMPTAGIMQITQGKTVTAELIADLVETFGMSFEATLNRLRNVGVLTEKARVEWQGRGAQSVLREAASQNIKEYVLHTEQTKVPKRLWRAAMEGYGAGEIGAGVPARLLGVDAEAALIELSEIGVVAPKPPEFDVSAFEAALVE